MKMTTEQFDYLLEEITYWNSFGNMLGDSSGIFSIKDEPPNETDSAEKWRWLGVAFGKARVKAQNDFWFETEPGFGGFKKQEQSAYRWLKNRIRRHYLWGE
jgi:hypothetical protein